jgi:hypothetical protein
LNAVLRVLLLRTIKKINWTDGSCGFSFLMIEIQPTVADCAGMDSSTGSAFFRPETSGAISRGRIGMKLAGFLLLLSGWGIVVATLPLLPSSPMRAAFVLAGTGVELIGLTLVVNSYQVPKG